MTEAHVSRLNPREKLIVFQSGLTGKECLDVIPACPTSNGVSEYLGGRPQQSHATASLRARTAGGSSFIPFEQGQGQDIIIFKEINKLCYALTAFISDLITGPRPRFIQLWTPQSGWLPRAAKSW